MHDRDYILHRRYATVIHVDYMGITGISPASI
jgi:hypothetical protein